MFNKVKKIFFFITILTFLFLKSKYYFSEKNIIFTNKSRSYLLVNLADNSEDIPLLKNDTEDIIVFLGDLEDFKKKKKKRIWEGLISDKDE